MRFQVGTLEYSLSIPGSTSLSIHYPLQLVSPHSFQKKFCRSFCRSSSKFQLARGGPFAFLRISHHVSGRWWRPGSHGLISKGPASLISRMFQPGWASSIGHLLYISISSISWLGYPAKHELRLGISSWLRHALELAHGAISSTRETGRLAIFHIWGAHNSQ